MLAACQNSVPPVVDNFEDSSQAELTRRIKHSVAVTFGVFAEPNVAIAGQS